MLEIVIQLKFDAKGKLKICVFCEKLLKFKMGKQLTHALLKIYAAKKPNE